MGVMAMFPLGSVLLPHAPLALRLFEPRYLVMLGQLLETPRPHFGVVLIERGHEVGGGEQRFSIGTVAEILQIEAREGYMTVLARGAERVRVLEWLPEDPYPRAEVAEIADLHWNDSLQPLRSQAEADVRNTLQRYIASGAIAPFDWHVSEDPVTACWELASLLPVGPLDQLRLLQSQSIEELLVLTSEHASDAEFLAAGWEGPGD